MFVESMWSAHNLHPWGGGSECLWRADLIYLLSAFLHLADISLLIDSWVKADWSVMSELLDKLKPLDTSLKNEHFFSQSCWTRSFKWGKTAYNDTFSLFNYPVYKIYYQTLCKMEYNMGSFRECNLLQTFTSFINKDF